MRKVNFLTMSVLCAAVMLCSCSQTGTKSGESTGSQTEQRTETFTLPAHEAFAEVPEEIECNFDSIIDSIERAYPLEEQEIRRYYGYVGISCVEGEECHVFNVYDVRDGNAELLAKAAVTDENSRVYLMDQGEDYRLFEDREQ
ncbi:MAG: hypothetical protein IJ806_11195 [Ruminococcus sp.]|nr:hypothetical protein [Ruminococcus sp.]